MENVFFPNTLFLIQEHMLLLFEFNFYCYQIVLYQICFYILGASEVSANLYCNSRTSVLGRLRDYLRLLMVRTLTRMYIVQVRTDDVHEGRSREFKYSNSCV